MRQRRSPCRLLAKTMRSPVGLQRGWLSSMKRGEAQPPPRVHVVAADAQLVALLAVEGERLAVGAERRLLGIVRHHLRLGAGRGWHGIDVLKFVHPVAVLHHARCRVENETRGNRVGRACLQAVRPVWAAAAPAARGHSRRRWPRHRRPPPIPARSAPTGRGPPTTGHRRSCRRSRLRCPAAQSRQSGIACLVRHER